MLASVAEPAGNVRVPLVRHQANWCGKYGEIRDAIVFNVPYDQPVIKTGNFSAVWRGTGSGYVGLSVIENF